MEWNPLRLRHSVAGKMLVIILGITVLLILFTILLVNQQFSTQIESNIRDNLQKAHSVYQSLQDVRLTSLRDQSSNISMDFRLKGTIDTRDINTIQQARGALNDLYQLDLFFILDKEGALIVPQSIESTKSLSNEPVVIDAGNGYDSADLWAYQGQVYEVAASPILASDKVIGIVLIGNRVDDELLNNVEELTGVSSLVYVRDHIGATSGSLSVHSMEFPWNSLQAEAETDTVATPRRITAGDMQYIVQSAAMQDILGNIIGTVVYYQSWDEAIAPLLSLRTELLIIGIISILIAVGAGIFLVSRLAAPLQRLVGATESVGQGKYDTPIDIDSNDEIGYLADAFQKMRISLKEAQEELIRSERLSTVGQMASSIIHDFKQPITSIYGYTDLLANENLPEEKRQSYADIIQKEIDRMMGMVNELLEFSRGETAMHFEEVSLKQFVRDAVEAFRHTAELSSIHVVTDQQADMEISLDQDRMQRVLDNLLRNAKDAMEDGGTIRILTEPTTDGARIRIEDSGPGIPAAIQESLFDPFVTAEKQSGTGLGLAIVKQIIEHHDGTITFTTERGEGTCFTIYLPKNPGQFQETQVGESD
ncbi:MAG: HAMP domain-containing protein [Candidatus Marinimicrobia bacterium]|nr:HAMP domain-containing protein [Candidatus Neomarinimicrobiota bacterium]MCF7829977.1 HAMP domain-containing protein [Candidatus Neomarinimicrobiota bacterium]MCF7881869.1 HAMP domain-containing protein [Candidatus Neomarinimicrobiota bacterium]